MSSLHCRFPRALLTAILLASTMLGCAAGDDNTGVGGVLVVSQVEVAGGDGVVLAGGTRQLQATPRTSTGLPVPGKTVAWASGNTSLATVSSSGLVTGVAEGATSITATVDGVIGRIDVQVRAVPVAAVQVTASVSTLEAGQTTQLQAATLDSVGGALGGRSVAWSSSNSLVATVSPSGLVTAVAAGSATITATSEERSGAVTLTITPRPASRVGFVAQPSNATAGVAMTPAIQVALQDEVGSTVTNATGTISLTFASNPGGASLTGVLSVQAVQGVATFPDVRVNRAGQGYTIRATAPGFAEAVSGTFSVSAGAPAALTVAVEPAGGSATGTAFSQQPVIQLRDAQGNEARQAGVTVTAVLASGPGTLNGTTSVVTGSDGRAVFTNLAIVGSVGSYALQFTATGLAPATSSPFSLGAGLATQLTFTAAPPGTTVNGQPLGTTVVVQLRDGTGNPVAQAGTLVTAAIQSGTGVLGGTVVVATGSTGAASFPGLVLTGIVGNVTLRFSAPGVSPAVSNAIALQPGAATQLTFTVAPDPATTNGVDLPSPIVVQLRDVGGNTVSTAGVNVAAAIQAGPGGVLSGTTTVPTDATGRATFSTLRITGLVGAYTLRFSAAGVSPATSNPVTLAHGAATALTIQVQPPASATNGVVLSPQPSLRVVDQSGNTVTSSALNVTAGLASGPGTLGGTLTVGTASGVAAFTNLSISGSTGTYAIAFTASGVTGVTSGTIGLGTGAIAGLAFVGTPPTSGASGIALNPGISVRLVDGSANPVPQAGVSVSAGLATGPGGLSGTLTAITDASGVATFTNLVLTGLVGNYTIQFSVSGGTSVTTGPIALTVGAATQLLFNQTPPGTATNGQPLASSTIVRLADAGGNLVPTDGVSVLATVASGPGATLGGIAARATVGGLATFDNLSLTGTVGTYTLEFTSGSLTEATSGGIQLQAGSATKLAFTASPPASAQSGTALSPAPVVQLQDVSNNNVSLPGVNVSVILVPTDLSVMISGGVAVTDASGRAIFSSLAITGPAGDYVLAFASSPLAGLLSPTITLTAGGAVKLGFVTTPSTTATNGQPLAQQPVVQLLDAADNPVAEAGRDITIGLQGGGALTATSLVVPTGVNGHATFSGVVITGLVGNRTLTFSGAGLSTLSSATIALGPGSAAALEMETQPPATATSGATFATAPAVRLVDESGNDVADAGVNISVAVSPSGTLGGTTTVATDGTGVATFAGLSITGAAGDYQLEFTALPLTAISSSTIAITAPGASGLLVTTEPSATVRNDLVFPIQPVIQLVDVSNSPVATAGVEITAAIATGGGDLLGTVTAVTNAGGAATFTSLRILGTIGIRTIQFTATGPTPATSGNIDVTAGVATALAMVTQPPDSTVAGQPLGASLAVKLVDVSGNDVDSAGVDVAVAIGAGATLGGTTTQATVVGGTATFPGLSVTGTTGTYQLTFSGASLTGATSSDMTLVVPASLVITTDPPAGGTNDVVLSPQPVVEARDGTNAPLPGVAITASLVPDAGAGTLVGTLTQVTGPGGSAIWTDLKIQGTGTFRLRFTAANGTEVTSTVQIVIP